MSFLNDTSYSEETYKEIVFDKILIDTNFKNCIFEKSISAIAISPMCFLKNVNL